MNTALTIVLVLGVSFIVVNDAVPRAPVKTIKVLPKAKQSATVAPRTKSSVNLQSSAQESTIELLAGPLHEPTLQLAQPSNNEPTKSLDLDSGRKLIEEVLANTSLSLSDKLVLSGEHDIGGKTVRVGSSKSISNGVSSVLTQSPPSVFLRSRSRKSQNEKIDVLAESLQQANLQISPQTLKEENKETVSRRERIHISDPEHQSSKILGEDVKFALVPNSFMGLKQESIVAPAQNYLTEPDKFSGYRKHNYYTPEEQLLPNKLALQSIDALVQESADILELNSITSLALEYLLPPLDIKKFHDLVRPSRSPSFGMIKEPDDDPVKTIPNLWESYEDGIRDSDYNSEYVEETSIAEDVADYDNILSTPNSNVNNEVSNNYKMI